MCIISQFVSFVSMKQRLAVVESELKELKRRDGESGELDVKKPPARHKRATKQQISVSELDKRIITLESRYDKPAGDAFDNNLDIND